MRGLYLITNDDPIEQLLLKLDTALATGHIQILQYRRKKTPFAMQPIEVAEIQKLCDRYRVPFIINDNIALAAEFGLGVHLGQTDGEIIDAKAQLPAGVIIGKTCSNSLEFAEKAVHDGATYVAFGAIYSTLTKPSAGCIGVDILKQARQRFTLPICAIGGLTVENSQNVIHAGADLCAVVSDILAQDVCDIATRVNAWANLFNSKHNK
ncbi:thiamine phosphate synthase [Acinetobacter sp. B5B]|uniref:thiamine phosphate synthase n=1 Tax=Acinetobacter baretiae TaxID=2605383 RepID=UPI0018C309EA|nr:thiamine phosphate synthase [Acinetobacter baretiae]MBF7682900.1 thiamine phosphate synthase [Acinetobacter baretiae]MBF7684866.1 thiamine phosphate synthase [Acinetobacter baretiae]